MAQMQDSITTRVNFTVNGNPVTPEELRTAIMGYRVICPDLLRLEQLGEADGPRGKLVRAFFWLIGPR